MPRFWSKVNKQGPYPSKESVEQHPEIKGTRCWLWLPPGYKYGQFLFKGKICRAHRVAYELQYGKIPKGKCVCHKCDVKKCMRHFFLGTKGDNNRDCVAKGRNSKGISHAKAQEATRSKGKQHGLKMRGELHGKAKLKDNDAIKIRKLHATGKYSQSALGIFYGVSQVHIGRIINRLNFTHV